MNGLGGLVGLVTGAGSGIGRATARALAGSGVAVGVLDIRSQDARSTVGAIESEGGRAIAVTVDVGEEASVHDAVTAVVDAFGGLDLAVNNAGVPSTNRDITATTADEWQETLRVNLTGTFWSMRHELPAMQARGGGAIVNVASNGGLYAIPHAPAYVASKHGIVGLSKAAAVDHAKDNIRVNSLCPSLTQTPMLATVAARSPFAAEQAAATPLGRLANPDEIAAAAVWLCSPAASYVTGIALSVDGGRRA